ncbi:MAG: PilZ domain-containing protein [Candidatus Omnitrophica bacterium]|nr:PilZ domain-containing protein [Candidatus Omnitrophota bacterium]
MINKRRFPRLSMATQIEYTLLEKSYGIVKSHTKDVSIAGLSIKTNELLEKGTYLDIKFYLPGDTNPIEAISKVVWSKQIGPSDFETGIEFVKINYADQERIGRLIAEP